MNDIDTQYQATCETPYASSDGESYTGPTQLKNIDKKYPLRVLSEKDWAFWKTNGYVIVPQAISKKDAQDTFDFLCEFQGIDLNDPSSWIKEDNFSSELERQIYIIGFVEAYNHQLMWNNRQQQRVYDAFVDVWDEKELWVTLDRAHLNPPNVGIRDYGTFLHWDVDTSKRPLPIRVQGIIALHDTEDELGGFQCIPSLFNNFDEWLKIAPEGRDPEVPGVSLTDFPMVRPQLKQGDLLIFDGLLAHGIAKNLSAGGVRSTQYVSMMPALESHAELRASRIKSWREVSTPEWDKSFLGGKIPESEKYGRAELNSLGEKLLGLKSWKDE